MTRTNIAVATLAALSVGWSFAVMGPALGAVHLVAQTPPASGSVSGPAIGSGSRAWPGRLSVRPREMATGTRTAQAGQQQFDALGSTATVYVPSQCVGARRCPLFVQLAAVDLSLHAPQADRYGMILLQISCNTPLEYFYNRQVTIDPGVSAPLVRELPDDPGLRSIDAALTRVLHELAIDPAKIALTGNSNEGAYALLLGRNNPDVFSRVLPTSPAAALPFDGAGPPDSTMQFYVSGGAAEPGFLRNAIEIAQMVRREGLAAKLVFEPRTHVHNTPEDVAVMWRWLHDSWTAPATVQRAAPRRVADAGPLLTAEALKRWTAFWTRYMQEPDSIHTAAQLTYMHEVPTLVGQVTVSLLMSDLSALAAHAPVVAADLEGAGLTARQAESYRRALLSAWATLGMQRDIAENMTDNAAGAVAPTSVLGRNIAFLAAQPALVQALELGQTTWATMP